VRNFVLFPTLVLPLTIGRAISSAAAQQAAREGRPIGLVMQRNADVDEPSAADLHGVGTIANVLRYVTAPDGVHLITQGVKRFRVKEILQTRPFFAVRAEAIDEDEPATDEIEARALHLKSQAAQALELIPQAPPEMLQAVENAASPGALADLIAAFMDSSPAEKQELMLFLASRLRAEGAKLPEP
jgi:ATP-dependent Lon protease